MGAKELDELCSKIYQAHRKAIDRIVESMPGTTEMYEALGERVIGELGSEWDYKSSGSCCLVFRKDWFEKLEEISYPDASVVHYEFSDWKYNKLRISFHVESIGEEKDFRVKFRETLRDIAKDSNFKEKLSGFNLDAKQVLYSRVVSPDLSRYSDEENVGRGAKEMIKFVKKTDGVVQKAVESLSNSISI